MTAIDETTQTGGRPRSDGRGERLPTAHRTVIMTLLVATFVVILNETIMGVALPHLMSDLDVSASTVQWLSTAFLLTMGVVIPTTGFLLQRLATKTVFILAMSLSPPARCWPRSPRASGCCWAPASCRPAARRSCCRC